MYRTIVEESTKNIIIMDVFSKLAQERIIFIDGEITDIMANEVIAQMLYLDSKDKNKPINIYINTIGGSIIAGLAIYDVSQIISAPIKTHCIGMAASMGIVLMLMGKERSGLPHCKLMCHTSNGGSSGKIGDNKAALKLQEELESEIFDIIKSKTKLPDASNFNFDVWFNAKEALQHGILTEIIKFKKL